MTMIFSHSIFILYSVILCLIGRRWSDVQVLRQASITWLLLFFVLVFELGAFQSLENSGMPLLNVLVVFLIFFVVPVSYSLRLLFAVIFLAGNFLLLLAKGFPSNLLAGTAVFLAYVSVMLMGATVSWNLLSIRRKDFQKSNRLNEYEQTFLKLFKIFPSGAYILDEKSRVTGWNQQAEQIIGWTEDDTRAKTIKEIFNN